jgi:hypothetical protein
LGGRCVEDDGPGWAEDGGEVEEEWCKGIQGLLFYDDGDVLWGRLDGTGVELEELGAWIS